MESRYAIKLKAQLKKNLIVNQCIMNKYVKTKIKIYNEEVYTNFQHNKISKIMNVECVYL